MNALIPLNIAALRVNTNDNSNVVNSFKGRVTAFQNLPYSTTPDSFNRAPTGDKINWPLQTQNVQQALGTGIHLHWELPDYFRKGVQSNQGGPIVFPQVPNRWLVVRFFSLFNNGSYIPVLHKGFIVESDYIADQQTPDKYNITRPMIPVPLPLNPTQGERPYKYMGRVLDYEDWDPSTEDPSNYLPAYKNELGQALYLDALGFVGSAFSSFYPSCRSVFGFWDNFSDLTNVSVPGAHGPTPVNIFNQIANNSELEFKTSYMVVGWINDPAKDPLVNMADEVKKKYAEILKQYNSEDVTIDQTPTDVFEALSKKNYKWLFNDGASSYKLNTDKSIKSLTVPTRTISQGISQQIVWNMLKNPTTTEFLKSPDGTPNNPGLWKDNVEIAIGNTSNEALSALMKTDLKQDTDPDSIVGNYEYLLDALQLGLLQRLEQKVNGLFELDEVLHSRSFSRLDGGQLWVVKNRQKENAQDITGAGTEVTLPLELAEYLHVLNKAQKDYDQSRAEVLTLRQQLFMDWDQYIHMYLHGSSETPDPKFLNELTSYILNNGDQNELKAVVNLGTETGILAYNTGPNGEIISPKKPSDPNSKASAVFTAYTNLYNRIKSLTLSTTLEIQSLPNKNFWMPTDPVLLMEGNKIEPVRRNGRTNVINVRNSGEIITTLSIKKGSTTKSVQGAELKDIPDFSSKQKDTSTDVSQLIQEAYFLIPMLADTVGAAYAAAGGTNSSDFIATLQNAQGGESQVDCCTNTKSLFCIVRQENYVPSVNPLVTTTTPLALSFTFTTPKNTGWAPDSVGWNTQLLYKELSPTRLDPFLPVFMIWDLKFAPLQWANEHDYNAENITKYFDLDEESIDYLYKQAADGNAIQFTVSENDAIAYDNSVVLSRTATYSLTAQIDSYIEQYPSDTETDDKLKAVRAVYEERKILSQTLSGFNNELILKKIIPKLQVNNLVNIRRDLITSNVKQAAIATQGDDWYNYNFNNFAPISTGPKALGNFGPLRSGFMVIKGLEIVDAFGQQMELRSEELNEDSSFQVIVANSLKPAPWDKENEHKIYFPPRIETPTRLWFRWLSATHDDKVSEVKEDFVEMNTHPATSPVTGWVLPNHLDNSLFFYNANGQSIGSFGVEHQSIVYRTTPVNINNPEDDLSKDIGPKGSPKAGINPHVADFMWYIDSFVSPKGGPKNPNDPKFLEDLMATIECSNKYIHPSKHQQSSGLPVLIGRPLALTRAVLALETKGNTLPLNQSNVDEYTPFHQNVVNDKYKYSDREINGSASISSVNFPLRLGNLPKIDDGLVGFLIEDGSAYKADTFYSPAAVADGQNKVTQPTVDTLQLNLNSAPTTITMLVDPRSVVHATTGILPVEQLSIPADQYVTTMRSLAMTFFTHPVLQADTGLVLPVPEEAGKLWSWIGLDGDKAIEIALKANASTQDATYSFTPQKVLEGWLELKEAPPVPPKPPTK